MYTEDDLVKIEQAITKLQMGESVVSVAYGDHIVKYAEVDLKDLLNYHRSESLTGALCRQCLHGFGR